MSTRRRSLRERKATKYDAESSDEDEEEEGSDPKMRNAKIKLKEMMREDSDAESDFEKDLLNDEAGHAQIGSDTDDDFVGEEKENKSPPKRMRRSCGKGLQVLTARPKSPERVKLHLGGVTDTQQALTEQNKGLNLSESDSSEDETLVENLTAKSAEKLSYPKSTIFQSQQPSLFNEEEGANDEGEAAASQKLMALAANLRSFKSAWVENPDAVKSEAVEQVAKKVEKEEFIKKSGKKASNKNKPHAVDQLVQQTSLDQKVDISNLLVQGEVTNDEKGEEEEDAEETEEREPLVSKDGVEITVAMPEGLKRKKKKGFDVAAYIKRKIGKARREVALLQHQAHYVCMLAHITHIDRILSKPVMKAVALSLVPTNHCRSPNTISLANLASLVTWVQGRMVIDTKPTSASSQAPRTCLALLRAMETFVCRDVTELVLVFVLICRSLGYSARYVANLALISHKPTDNVKLSGEGSLRSNLATLHGRRMCTAEQSLKRGLSDSSAQMSSAVDELKADDHKEKSLGKSARKKAGGQTKVESIPGKPLPAIKVENADKSPKSEVKVEKEAADGRSEPTDQLPEKEKGRSRSRRKSGIWETILKSPDVKAEQGNSPKSVASSKDGKCKAIDASEKEGKLDNPTVEQGRGKRKSSGRLVTSPTKASKKNPEVGNEVKNSKPSKLEDEGEAKVKENLTRRTSKRLSAAHFSTGKLKPEDKVTDGTKKVGEGKENDSDSDFEPTTNVTPKSVKKSNEKDKEASVTSKKTPKSVKGGKKHQKRAELESDAEDDDFEPPAKKTPKNGKKVWCEQNQWFANSVAPKSGKMGKKSKKVWCDQEDHWAEVYLEVEGRWVTVDLVGGLVDKPLEVAAHCSRPILHVLGVEGGIVKDVTRRYTSDFLTEVRKLRTDANWLEKTLAPFKCLNGGDERERKEEEELNMKVNEAPLPSTIGQFKDHPLYALERHLLKFEKIYPPNAPTLGFTKSGEAVYARECVRTLNGRTHWLKEGRTVKVGEVPYKVVKARPKWTRTPAGWIRAPDEDLDVFGEWQTKLFEAPPAVDGMVPRNEYGNVELFKPWMLPPGTVHVQETIPKYLIRRTGIDAAPAMIGWDFSGGGCHPVFDGLVVCKENEIPLRDAWAKEQELQDRREKEKKEKRVLDHWKKLVRGLVIKQKIKLKYMKD